MLKNVQDGRCPASHGSARQGIPPRFPGTNTLAVVGIPGSTSVCWSMAHDPYRWLDIYRIVYRESAKETTTPGRHLAVDRVYDCSDAGRLPPWPPGVPFVSGIVSETGCLCGVTLDLSVLFLTQSSSGPAGPVATMPGGQRQFQRGDRFGAVVDLLCQGVPLRSRVHAALA